MGKKKKQCKKRETKKLLVYSSYSSTIEKLLDVSQPVFFYLLV